MRLFVAFAVFLAVAPASAHACKITNFTYRGFGQTTIVNAETTCQRGKVVARFYSGPEGETYLGNATGYIQGHALTLLLSAPAPDRLRMKVAISPR